MKALFAIFALIASVSLSLSAQAAPELIDQDPIAVPAKLTDHQISSDIKRALTGRGWIVTKQEAGQIDATLNIRSHVARVSVTYTPQQVKLVYVSSENLDYKEKDGKRYIHRNYNSWVKNVLTDINKNMLMSADLTPQ